MIIDISLNSILPPTVFDDLRRIIFNKSDEFNSLIGSVSETLSDNLDWWVEQPASRNTLQSPLYYRFCCLHLVNEMIQSGTKIEKVIVDSPALFRAINQIKEKEDYSFEIEGPNGELPNFHYFFRKSLKLFLNAWKRQRILFRAAKNTKHLCSKPPKSGLILIDQFVFPGFITKERYYNGLWDTLSSDLKQKTFFVPTFAYMKDDDFESAYNELRTCDKNFLIKEDYLSISDLLFSLFHLFRVWFIKPHHQEVLGFDFSQLIREELLSGEGYDSALEGLLNYRFAKRLKEQSFDLSLVIDWWEGQSPDKGWNLGFNTFFPDTLIKGYLGYAPAFRFGHLWENGSVSERDSGSFKILLALSILLDESVNIYKQVIDSGLGDENELEFMIKPHPTMNMSMLKNRLGEKWTNIIKVVEGCTPDYIRKSDLLITGMSSVGLEAVVMGVPVIVVETMNGRLAFDPIPDTVPKELWRSCRSPEEISESIDHFRNRTLKEISKHKKLSDHIKNDYFEPVTKESVYRFLELSN